MAVSDGNRIEVLRGPGYRRITTFVGRNAQSADAPIRLGSSLNSKSLTGSALSYYGARTRFQFSVLRHSIFVLSYRGNLSLDFMWYDDIIRDLKDPQVINDSKTPSGKIHVGSLRGVLIHDALYRALKQADIEVTYLYGIDDYDPLDSLPSDAADSLKAYMGYPLCNISAPPGSNATDLADHYIGEFLGIFREVGIGAKVYRMRDVYRSGQFNESIDVILRASATVRRVYEEVSYAVRPQNWHPFQVICENCRRIGTTEVTAYDGHEVTYHCRPDLVRWAVGCDHKGKTSPFDGRGKLPWKLEWVAKWHTFGISIEGAGKDHCTKGGSRDVAAKCFQAIYGETPPLNVPYEFFLVQGAKMSSSRGVGTAARDIADFLPPEILRFLMIRTPPRKTVNFSTDYDYMVKLFNEHDRLLNAKLNGTETATEAKMLNTIEVDATASTYRPIPFQLLCALLQMPHLDIETEVSKRFGTPLKNADRMHLDQRLRAAKYWLANYAADEDRFELQPEVPASVDQLSVEQKAFLVVLAECLRARRPTTDDEYQTLIFDAARITPLDQGAAFKALYKALLDKDCGPKGGSLLAFLEPDFLEQRLSSVQFSKDQFWNQTGITAEQLRTWVNEHHHQVEVITIRKYINVVIGSGEKRLQRGDYCRGRGVIEFYITHHDGKIIIKRVLFSDFEGHGIVPDSEAAYLEEYGNEFINQLKERYALVINKNDPPEISFEVASSEPHVPTVHSGSVHVH